MSGARRDPPFAAGATVTPAEALAVADRQLAAGELGAAETLGRRVLAADPGSAPALHLLGVIGLRRGDLAAAIDLVRRAAQADGSSAIYLSNLCEIYRLAGRLDDALAAGGGAISLAPGNPQALNNLAIVQFERGEHAAAAALYRRAIAAAPDYPEAHNNLGNLLRTRRAYDEALAAYARALALRPAYPDAFNNLGTTLRDMGRTAQAELAYRKAHALDPVNVAVLSNLALALKDLDRPDEAAALFDRVLALDPSNVAAMVRLAQVRLDQRRIEAADEACRRALALRAEDPEALNVLGLIALERHETDAALAFFQRAIEADPGLAEAHNNAGNVLKEQGRLSEAGAAFERALELEPRQSAFFANLADGRAFVEDDPYLLRMEALARDVETLAPTPAMQLHFALAKAYDDLGRHGPSFEQLLAGNRIKRGKIEYDEAATLRLFDRVRASFDRSRLAAGAAAGDQSELPIFVVGMPRSGTTLVEQIIASHPLAHGAGELNEFDNAVGALRQVGGDKLEFPESVARIDRNAIRMVGERYVARLRRHSATAARIVDKMPSNFFFLGLISLALPNARIVHVLRNPADTCLSCFSKLFTEPQDHAYDLAELGRYYRKYAQLMDHWRAVLPPGRLYEIRYEDVVADLEGSARRLIAHCGLPWDARCLDFHASGRRVRTASAHQVRRPIYATSVDRWRAYRAHLAPLLAELGELAPIE